MTGHSKRSCLLRRQDGIALPVGGEDNKRGNALHPSLSFRQDADDEYDVPLAKASERNTEANGFYPKMLDLIRGMFDAAFKTNEFLNCGVSF